MAILNTCVYVRFLQLSAAATAAKLPRLECYGFEHG
jgi:hypothetical protein